MQTKTLALLTLIMLGMALIIVIDRVAESGMYVEDVRQDEWQDVRQDGVAYVEPAKLFAGEAARIEPHVGLQSAGSAIAVYEAGLAVRTWGEVWVNGELVYEAGGIGITFEDDEQAKIFVSVISDVNPEGNIEGTVSIHVGQGSQMSGVITFPAYDSDMRRGFYAYAGPGVYLEPGEVLTLMEMVATDTDGSAVIRSGGVEDYLHEYDWVFLFKIQILAEEDMFRQEP